MNAMGMNKTIVDFETVADHLNSVNVAPLCVDLHPTHIVGRAQRMVPMIPMQALKEAQTASNEVSMVVAVVEVGVVAMIVMSIVNVHRHGDSQVHPGMHMDLQSSLNGTIASHVTPLKFLVAHCL